MTPLAVGRGRLGPTLVAVVGSILGQTIVEAHAMTTLDERDEMEAWREAHPEAALAEAVSVVIGLVLTYEPNEDLRKAAVNTLIECHRRALNTPAPRLH
jgi:hypothetical protein